MQGANLPRALLDEQPGPPNWQGPGKRVIDGNVRATTQEDLAQYSGVVEVTGSVVLTGDISLVSLEPLSHLTTIHGDLILYGMYNLGNVDGLSSLQSIGGMLSITGSNIGSMSLSGLYSLERIGGDYQVSVCDGDVLLDQIGAQNIEGRIIVADAFGC